MCVAPQFCGQFNTLPCGGPFAFGPVGPPSNFNTWNPTLQVAVPDMGGPGAAANRIQFAQSPIPDLQILKNCRDGAVDKDDFDWCMVESALPDQYRLTRDCLDANEDDEAAAFVCSTGDKNLEQTYQRVKDVQECASDNSKTADVASCLGESFLGPNERYYAECVRKNKSSYSAAAVCAMSKDLTPEQQIALSCAMASGGEPMTFAGCAGGQLAQREIEKCWQHGIATDKGCFGPNNEIRKYWDRVDGTLRDALGPNNEAYRAFLLYKNNVVMPGPNHEFVRAANTVIRDVREGPGRNNDIVKAGRAISGGLQSIGKSLGF